MTNTARRGLILAFLLLLLVQVGLVQAAPGVQETTIMVLPFQVNAGKDLEYLNEDLPELVAQRLVARGLNVLPQSDVKAILRRQRVTELDIASARNLAVMAQAGYTVYGSFT